VPINLQNFTQKDLTEVKIFQKGLGDYFFETPVQSLSMMLEMVRGYAYVETK